MSTFGDYEDKIEEWHEMSDAEWELQGKPPLHEYLGLTWEEYKGLFNNATGIH